MSEIFTHLNATQPSALPSAGFIDISTANMDWQDCGAPGFTIKPLIEDAAAGLGTWLMKVDAGAYSPMHAHDEIEQKFVLQGTFYDQDNTYTAGDYILRGAGSRDGATVLLVYSPAVKAK